MPLYWHSSAGCSLWVLGVVVALEQVLALVLVLVLVQNVASEMRRQTQPEAVV